MGSLTIESRAINLDDVVGQDHIVTAFRKRFKDRNFPTATLLKGISGTGKTTIAQIIAMAMVCKSPKEDGNPCGICLACKDVTSERFSQSVIRLTGGLEGKDDIVDTIQSRTAVSPMGGGNTVFIIEEVDGLSPAAKNALLKLLETPKPKYYFILLSMKNGGLPTHILDRCTKYTLVALTTGQILKTIKGVLTQLGKWDSPDIPKSFYLEVLPLIANASKGSLRACISLLEGALDCEFYTKESVASNPDFSSSLQTLEIISKIAELKKDVFLSLDYVDPRSFVKDAHELLADCCMVRSIGVGKEGQDISQLEKVAKHTNFKDLLVLWDKIISLSQYTVERAVLVTAVAQYFFSKTMRIVEDVDK